MQKLYSPLVTIAIATHNGEDTIQACIQSALNQTYKNLEILISDDCSTDNTQKICTQYAEESSKIKYIGNLKQLGIMNNYNSLLNRAKGELFILFDQDDFRDNDFVEKSVRMMRDPRTELVVGNVRVIFNGTLMHINNFARTAYDGNCVLRIYHLLRRPSDFLLYGMARTKTLRELGGWTLGTSSFYRVIFAICLVGEISTIDSSHFYSAKGANGRPTRREELKRNGYHLSDSIPRFHNFFEIPFAYISEILKSSLNPYQKIGCFALVAIDALIKTTIKLFIKILYQIEGFQFRGNLEKFLIHLYHPIDNIEFLSDRKDYTNGYYREKWPLI